MTNKQRSATAADLAALSDAIDDIIRRTRAGILGRSNRIAEIDALASAFYVGTGDRIPEGELARLTDAILDEELRDRRPDKVTLEEYPILSESQFDERRRKEIPLKVAEDVGTDGRNYRVPVKRKRSGYERWKIDEDARVKNRRRNAQYKRDTSLGAISSVLSQEWTESSRILERFAVIPVYYR
jgi:hypothetical protein